MFGKFLHYLIEKHNLDSMEQLGRMGGISGSTVRHCVLGDKRYQNPTLSLLQRYARGFGMTASGFIKHYEQWKKSQSDAQIPKEDKKG